MHLKECHESTYQSQTHSCKFDICAANAVLQCITMVLYYVSYSEFPNSASFRGFSYTFR
jgi:hypothetical protein